MIKFTKDIGMFSLAKPMDSCVFMTDACLGKNGTRGCYARKFFKIWPKSMKACEEKLSKFWKKLTPKLFNATLARKKKDTSSFRWATRGEIFSTPEDIFKVRAIIKATPAISHWIPTRSWVSPIMRTLIEEHILPLSNAFVLASIDSTHTKEQQKQVEHWNQMHALCDIPEGAFLCPKTYKKDKTACQNCSNNNQGCFSPQGAKVRIHLRGH